MNNLSSIDINTNSWKYYQHSRFGDNVEDRIKLWDLEQYSSPEWTLLDTGASNGKFTSLLGHLFKKCVAVEPFADPVTQPANVTWIKKGFKDFYRKNIDQFDVIYSFAMTLQIEEYDLMTTDEITQSYNNLLKPNGIIIYETQNLYKLSHRTHALKMLKSFKNIFGKEFRTGQGRTRNNRSVHFWKKNKNNL
jgi:2-polyprenyl-3-methyl-5-hydroxy-6-metoxy-1,4-benzoquinol methylase|tara:strand:- start:116 stop:691 length:576 start_codon:yes stop_codon:yes gene_type:complete